MNALQQFKQEAIDRFETITGDIDITKVSIGEEHGKTIFKIIAYLGNQLCYGRAESAGKAIDRCIESKAIYSNDKKRVSF